MRVGGSAAWVAAGLALGLGWAWGCGAGEVFQCESDGQCGDGSCANGYCAFADDDCPSGRRYGSLARDGLAGKCVADEPGTTSDGTGSSEGTQGGTSGGTTDPTLGTSTTRGDATSMVDPTNETTGGLTLSGSAGSSTGDSTSSGSTGLPPVTRVDDGLLAYYRPDQVSSGTTIPDLSGVDPAVDMTLQGNGFSWVTGGLRTSGEGIVVASGSGSKIRNACQNSNALTIEAWVTPFNGMQPGPARIVTYSEDESARYFMVGQGTSTTDPDGWMGRVRTTLTDGNGLPAAETMQAVDPVLTHVVLTHDASATSRLYLDGELANTLVVGGDLSVWAPSATYQFAWGNEVTLNRPWVGDFHLVAVYDRALSGGEVAQNFDAGL